MHKKGREILKYISNIKQYDNQNKCELITDVLLWSPSHKLAVA